MKIISFRGVVFSEHDFWVGITNENGRGRWAIIPSIAARQNEAGEITGVTIGERPIVTQIGHIGAAGSHEAAFYHLLGKLNPLGGVGELVMETNAGAQFACNALVITPGEQTIDGEVNTIAVVFLTTDPMWRALEETTGGPATVANDTYGGLAVTIAGDANVHGRVRLTPVSDDKMVQMQAFSVTNGRTTPLVNFPVRVDFGSTWPTPWSVPPTQFALIKDGQIQRCQMVNPASQQTYLWIVVDYLAPGQSADYMLLSGDSYPLPGTEFNSYTQPAFDTSWQRENTTSAGTSTVHSFTGQTWETNQWRGGVARVLTGTHAGLERTISASTADTITTAAFPSGIGSGTPVLLTMSFNGKWVYPVRQTERSDSRRGLWWINQGQKRPGDARHDVPGAFRPHLYYDNGDIKNQSDFFGVNVGTFDWFSSLDADRSFPGGSALVDNGADGIAITLPFPISTLRFSYQLKNPNGMATFVVGTREAGGALGYIHEFTDSGQYDTLTDRSEQTLTLTSDTRELYLGIIPTTLSDVIQDEIGIEWAGDEGTATSGSTSQLNDNTKQWISDQFIGGSIRIISGTGAGQERTIDDNGTNTVTPSSTFTTAPDNTSRYRIRQKQKLVSTVRTNDRFELFWDATGLTVSTPTAAVFAYLVDRNLYIDRATEGADPPYQVIGLSPSQTGRYLVLAEDESLVIDGEQMRAWIEGASGNELRRVPPRAIRVLDVEADGTERLAERWLWLTPDEHTLMLSPVADGNDYSLELTYEAAVYG